jgi:glycerate-2-kinase
MLHLSTEIPSPKPEQRLHAEPVTRLASLRNALRVVDEFGGGPAPDIDDELSERWESADGAAKRCFDRRSAELVAVASAGLEAVSFHREQGLDASVAALRVIADELKGGLKDLERIFRR